MAGVDVEMVKLISKLNSVTVAVGCGVWGWGGGGGWSLRRKLQLYKHKQ